MKKQLIKSISSFAFLSLTFYPLISSSQDMAIPLQQQVNELGKFANSYIGAYAQDFSSNFGYSLNQGWGYGRQPGKLGSVSFSLVASSAFIPQGQGYMNTAALYQSPANIDVSPSAATLFSGDMDGWARFYVLNPISGERLIDPRNGAYVAGDMELLDGVGSGTGFTPYALPQLTVGVGLGTELSLRALPLRLQVNDGDDLSLSAFGIGIRHDLSQHLRALAISPVKFNLLLSYMQQKTSYTPQDGRIFDVTSNYFTTNGSDMRAVHRTKSYQAVLSGVYEAPRFASFSAQLGLIRQVSILDGLGTWRFDFNLDDLDVETEGLEATLVDPLNVSRGKTVALVGASVLLGKGFFQTELQYAYAHAHTASIAFRFHLFNGVGLD